jgi:hypothetical protein
MAQDEEGLLQRWSRRKLEQRERERQAAPPPQEEEIGDNTGVATAGEGAPGDVPPAAADPVADFPSIESLTRDSDFTVFMREGVPEDVRNLALRKLWRSDPVFANLDGMLEYGEDYSQWFKPGVSATLKTLYRVGQGYLADDAEAAPEPPAEGSAPAAAAPFAEAAAPDPGDANRGPLTASKGDTEASESPDVETPTPAELDKA